MEQGGSGSRESVDDSLPTGKIRVASAVCVGLVVRVNSSAYGGDLGLPELESGSYWKEGKIAKFLVWSVFSAVYKSCGRCSTFHGCTRDAEAARTLPKQSSELDFVGGSS